jgi:hypothetical protein
MLRSVWTELDCRIDICFCDKRLKRKTFVTLSYKLTNVLQNHVSILDKSLIISFQYNIESVYFFYSNPVFNVTIQYPLLDLLWPYMPQMAIGIHEGMLWQYLPAFVINTPKYDWNLK